MNDSGNASWHDAADAEWEARESAHAEADAYAEDAYGKYPVDCILNFIGAKGIDSAPGLKVASEVIEKLMENDMLADDFEERILESLRREWIER